MSDKIKILFAPSDLAGVGHFRSIWPAQEIQRNHKDSFDVKIEINPRVDDLEALKKYDIIHFHRHFGPIERLDEIFDTLQSAGGRRSRDARLIAYVGGDVSELGRTGPIEMASRSVLRDDDGDGALSHQDDLAHYLVLKFLINFLQFLVCAQLFFYQL